MVASMTVAVTRGEPAGTYLGPHHRYLRQLDDVGAHCVKHVLQLVYYGDKSLHVRGVWGNKTNEAAMFVMEPKSFNVPLKPPLRQHPTHSAGSCSPLAHHRPGFGNGKNYRILKSIATVGVFALARFARLMTERAQCQSNASQLAGWLYSSNLLLFTPFWVSELLSERSRGFTSSQCCSFWWV